MRLFPSCVVAGVIITTLFAHPAAMAIQESTPVKVASVADSHKEIELFLQQYQKAFEARDADAVAKCLTDDSESFDILGVKSIGKQAVEGHRASFGAISSLKTTITLLDLNSTSDKPNTATVLVRSTGEVGINRGAGPETLSLERVSVLGLIKDGADWKIRRDTSLLDHWMDKGESFTIGESGSGAGAHYAIQRKYDALVKAKLAGDKNKLNTLLADTFSKTTPNAPTETKQGFIDSANDPNEQRRYEVQRVEALGTTATAHVLLYQTFPGKDKEGKDTVITNVTSLRDTWEKVDNNWKLTQSKVLFAEDSRKAEPASRYIYSKQ